MIEVKLTADRCQDLQLAKDQFLKAHGEWFSARARESLDVFCIVCPKDVGFAGLYQLQVEKEVAAEKAYLRLCQSFRLVGLRALPEPSAVFDSPFIDFPWFHRRTTDRKLDSLKTGAELGWTDQQIQATRTALRKAGQIAERMAGAAGRLVCNRRFIAERDHIQQMWEALPQGSRPHFPLWRRYLRTQHHHEGFTICHSSEWDTFVTAWELFCHNWALEGLETWELPRPEGPQWPDLRPGCSDPGVKCAVTVSTPWHFAALESDGLGDLPMARHKADRGVHGVDDARSWQLYAQLFRLNLWERILRGRYAGRKRPRNFVTRIESLLSTLLSLSTERVERLRKLRSALISGRRKTLAGVR